jgi:hypothetical protein
MRVRGGFAKDGALVAEYLLTVLNRYIGAQRFGYGGVSERMKHLAATGRVPLMGILRMPAAVFIF